MSRTRHVLSALGLCGGLLFLAGGSVSFYEEALPTTMNPLFARGMVDHRTHELVFDRLFFRSAITNELKSNLVLKYQKLEDGKKLKIYLKDGVKWHDGKAFGPKDVCFTIDAMLNPKTPSPIAKEYRESIVGCESFPKENAVVVEFVKAYVELRERVAFAVLPAHTFDSTAISPDLDFSSRPVGTGPMKAAKGRQAVTYTAFPNAHHNARIESMQSQEGGDPFVQVRTLLTGGVQGLVSVAPAHRPGVRASDDVALKSYDLRSWWFIALNTNKGALANQKVRQAIDLTLDRNQLRELAIGVKSDDANSPCEFVSGPFVGSSPYYNRAVKPRPEADRAKAEQLMTAAGASKQADRWLYEGEAITLRLGMNAPLDTEAKDLLNQVGNQLQEGGFDRQVYKVNNDDWTQRAITGQLAEEFDALIGKWSFGVVEEVNPMFHTRGNGRGALNIFNYSNPKVDELLAKYDDAHTDTEAQDAYHELHRYLAEDLPYIFLWKLDTKSAWRNEVRNNTISPYFYFTEFDGWRL
ncbi:MAG: ABC transporter substrate-binding protein [Alphaproteobacteria bacterium]|nr:ABC transporter substrate-binding protein [Alphaproteobacteria bacterium]